MARNIKKTVNNILDFKNYDWFDWLMVAILLYLLADKAGLIA